MKKITTLLLLLLPILAIAQNDSLFIVCDDRLLIGYGSAGFDPGVPQGYPIKYFVSDSTLINNKINEFFAERNKLAKKHLRKYCRNIHTDKNSWFHEFKGRLGRKHKELLNRYGLLLNSLYFDTHEYSNPKIKLSERYKNIYHSLVYYRL